MKKLFFSIAIISLALTCCGPKEAKWIKIHDDPSLTLYVDHNSITHVSKNIVRAWVTFSYKQPREFESKRFQRALSHDEIDCARRTLQIIQVVFYFTDGTNQPLSEKLDSSKIMPETPAEFEYNYLCKQ